MKIHFPILVLLFLFLFSCQKQKKKKLAPGVSYELAQERFNDISEVEYLLELDVPDSLNHSIHAKSTISFTKQSTLKPLILDFVSSEEKIKSVSANGQKVFFSLENEHLIIPTRFMQSGKNEVTIDYIMGEGALNRNEDYLYSLFVPDRARTAIPCFDQPDIKAKVSYSINMPKAWTAITNGKEDFYEEISANKKHVTFSTSKPISSYLWAFAIGNFKQITKTKNGFEVSVYHMEKDSTIIKRNINPVFDQIFHSIQWLEDYTEIDFPFNKYDLVCIPSFQFAGMEHPGAIYYRSDLLFLSENPTQKQLLKRAQLIAHETAHVWFGDLVTMKWFSGVWQKEVFANFIADKIIEEQFPDLNHQLTFLINHFPASFSIDRTIGANPIKQKLENMNNAGSMYGSIIYHKAPIMMNQLEYLTGKELLREGLGEYLRDYGYRNASWRDLMKILNNLSEYNLELWSNNWVNEAGRPVINFSFENDQLVIKQKAEYIDNKKVWAQRINFRTITDTSSTDEMGELLASKTVINGINIKPKYILPTIDEAGYGLFIFDPISLQYAINNIHVWDDELVKGATLIQLFENFLYGEIQPSRYLHMLRKVILHEENEQLLTLACQQLNNVFWRFTTPESREEISAELEKTLLTKSKKSSLPSVKKMIIEAWSGIVTSSEGLRKLEKITVKKRKFDGIKFSERDLSRMAFQLALKSNEFNDAFILYFAHTLDDEELKNMMTFVSPVFSEDKTTRESFIYNLTELKNRKKENWVLNAVKYFHHPYHQEKHLQYLEGALDLTKTIKETGDIFFPKGWLDNSLWGYGSTESLQIINYFFKDNPQYPEDLKNKIIQSSDMIKRSRKIKAKYYPEV